jgi:hypothetical protein
MENTKEVVYVYRSYPSQAACMKRYREKNKEKIALSRRQRFENASEEEKERIRAYNRQQSLQSYYRKKERMNALLP